MDNLHVHPVCEAKTPVLDYDSQGNLLYFGQNTIGSLTSAVGWSMKKFIYNEQGDLVTMLYAVGIWDNRNSITFK